MELHYKTFGEGTPLLILHGLFGSSDNWLTIGKKLAEQYQVYLIDQRNHGRSPWSDQWNYEAMSDDLHEFVEQHQLQDFVLIGHSMGGKTAMNYAVNHTPSKIEKLVVVDIAPKTYPIHHDKIVAGLNALDLSQVNSRKAADEQLAAYIDEVGVRQFLLKNLYRNEEKNFEWRINLPVIGENLTNVSGGLTEDKQYEGTTLFIRGRKSNYIKEDDEAVIHQHFPQATLQTVENAGHWVHAESPAEFLEMLLTFLQG
ncbi:alpha/beta fold hydrolase [Microscilla marina]|uniref:Alpha/beta superfamily hydrolase n=1 Tax=Microscilla marina ATCC 23134 TaxID=313606 RepID=A1ZRV7_MICM2|nr:alpha/beta fold hydrolase [Microscilla marina]EAY26845.1 alpha/beta superfamily hydrolase [Microscilla marina ATCC 23134]